MRPHHLVGSGPWVEVGLTFLTGAAAGIAVFAWTAMRSPEMAAWLFDPRQDGLGAFDAFVVSWLFGHLAVLLHHVLPGMARD